MLKAWGEYGKTRKKWIDYNDGPMPKEDTLSSFADVFRIKTIPEQDQTMIDFVLKNESHLMCVYCINRGQEILSAGGINGVYHGTEASFTAGGLIELLQLRNECLSQGLSIPDTSEEMDAVLRAIQ